MRETLGVALVGKRAGAFIAGFSATPGVRIVAVCGRGASARGAVGGRGGGGGEGRDFDLRGGVGDARPDARLFLKSYPPHEEGSAALLRLRLLL